MKRPAPVNSESPFEINELFFSTTDSRGVIKSGNSVFVRVSGYSEEFMLGKPHSLIRHPDMPKAVFKYLWDEIKAGRSVVAYVKNLAADGRYYWVMAFVSPADDGYISIRMKPSTQILKIVEGLYRKVLEVEKAKGMDESLKFMVEQVAALGFSSYHQFSLEALMQELESRESLIQSKKHDQGLPAIAETSPDSRLLAQAISRYSRSCIAALSLYPGINKHLRSLGEARKRIEAISGVIAKSSKELEFLPINMAIESNRAGTKGATLSVVSNAFRTWVADAESAIQTICSLSTDISHRLDTSSFTVAASRLRIEMVRFLVEEITAEAQKADWNPSRTAHGLESLNSIAAMARDAIRLTESDLRNVLKTTREISVLHEQVKSAVLVLTSVKNNGKVEVAHFDGDRHGFNTHLESMSSYLKKASDDLNSLHEDIVQIEFSLRAIFESVHESARLLA